MASLVKYWNWWLDKDPADFPYTHKLELLLLGGLNWNRNNQSNLYYVFLYVKQYMCRICAGCRQLFIWILYTEVCRANILLKAMSVPLNFRVFSALMSLIESYEKQNIVQLYREFTFACLWYHLFLFRNSSMWRNNYADFHSHWLSLLLYSPSASWMCLCL